MAETRASETMNGQVKGETTDPEVVPRAERRRFTTEYKLGILAEAEACQQPGEVGALLRREGLYSSHLNQWRQQQAAGQLGQKRRGRKADPQAVEVARLRRENERLHAQVERAEAIIEVQKKLCMLLGLGPTETRSHERR